MEKEYLKQKEQQERPMGRLKIKRQWPKTSGKTTSRNNPEYKNKQTNNLSNTKPFITSLVKIAEYGKITISIKDIWLCYGCYTHNMEYFVAI